MNKLYLDIETLPAEESKSKILLDIYERKKKREINLVHLRNLSNKPVLTAHSGGFAASVML